MLTQNAIHHKILKRYAVLLPVMILAIFAASMIQPNPAAFNHVQKFTPVVLNDTTIYTDADVLPIFKECEDIKNLEEQKSCSDNKMLMFIYRNIKYPEAARKSGKEGTVVVRFVVEKDGSMTNIEIVRTISEEIDEESLRVVKLMGRENMWLPGLIEGEPIRFLFNLPIRYRLDG